MTKSKYIKSKEIAEITECCYSRAQEILREVNQKLEAQGYLIVNNRKAPRKEVLKYLGLEENS